MQKNEDQNNSEYGHFPHIIISLFDVVFPVEITFISKEFIS